MLAEAVDALPGGRVERDLTAVGTAYALRIAPLGRRGEMGALFAEELPAVVARENRTRCGNCRNPPPGLAATSTTRSPLRRRAVPSATSTTGRRPPARPRRCPAYPLWMGGRSTAPGRCCAPKPRPGGFRGPRARRTLARCRQKLSPESLSFTLTVAGPAWSSGSRAGGQHAHRGGRPVAPGEVGHESQGQGLGAREAVEAGPLPLAMRLPAAPSAGAPGTRPTAYTST